MKWLSLVLLPIACSNLFGALAVLSGLFGFYWLSNSPVKIGFAVIGLIIAVLAIRSNVKASMVMGWLFIAAAVGSIVTLIKGVELSSMPAIALSVAWGTVFGISAVLSYKYKKRLLQKNA
ncbi:hypothetical protein [Marinimicrobium locisalis]|uniref:hypothetical protein n=1 Tax=Marinimicrobium locisalis TaxID=546022 RepID=UPI003221C03E